MPVSLRDRYRSHEVGGCYNFAVRVLPMDWSWSVFLMQTAHVHMVDHLSRLPWVVGKSPCAAFGPNSPASGVRLLYIDNFAVLGSDRASAVSARDDMIRVLSEKGIASEADPDDHQEMIGFSLDRQHMRWRPTWNNISRFVAAGRWLLRPGARASGQEIERFVGHAVHLLGIRTELMSIPSLFDIFLHKNYKHRVPL